MSEESLAVCILFHEKPDQTSECIDSFLASGINVYVLNNDSSASAREKVGTYCTPHKQVKIIDSEVNLGVGIGRNRLIEETTEEWLLFVDNDITMKTAEWKEVVLRHIRKRPEMEVWLPKLFNVHEGDYLIHQFIHV